MSRRDAARIAARLDATARDIATAVARLDQRTGQARDRE